MRKKKRYILIVTASFTFISLSSRAGHGNGTNKDSVKDIPRPRVIIMSDFPPLDVIPVKAPYGPLEKLSDPDDIQSMVRFLLYSNDLEVEGLIATAGTRANIARKQNILDLLNFYDQVDENLRKHDQRYPTADQLRSVTWQGRDKTYGKKSQESVGKDMDTEASNAIIHIVDKPDDRPVFVCAWGVHTKLLKQSGKLKIRVRPMSLDAF